jgi:hypothetical protein
MDWPPPEHGSPSMAVALDHVMHKIPAPPKRLLDHGSSSSPAPHRPLEATPTVRHPSPVVSAAEAGQQLVSAFTAESDRTKQLVMDFTCREHERFLVATEELYSTVSVSLDVLVAKYTALAMRLDAPLQEAPPNGPRASSGFRRPVLHSSRVVQQRSG